MKLESEKTMTSPRAIGTPKASIGSFGAVGNVKKVGLVRVDGGQDKYKGQKSDMNLDQLGGEGGGKDGKVPSGSDMSLLMKKVAPEYTGPGRELKRE